MARTITLEQLINRIPSVARFARNGVPGLLLVSGKRLEGEMKKRIFNNGLDSFGQRIGSYSEGYAKLRNRNGFQTSFVDLQLTGNLFSNFQTLKEGEEVVLAIPNDFDFKKAVDNEARFKTVIFEPTEGEEESAEKDFQSNVENLIVDLFNNL